MSATTTTMASTTSDAAQPSSQSSFTPDTTPSSSPSYSWMRGPLPLIPTPRAANPTATDQVTWVATEMALVHNIVIRSLNSIYLQAPHVPESHHLAFTYYMLATWQTLHDHHTGEERSLFPEIEEATGEKGLMEVNVQQHQAFEEGFDVWGNWIKDLEKGKEAFSAAKCQQLMDVFMHPLATHLAEEIPCFMALSKYPESQLPIRKLWEDEGKNIMGSMSKTRQLPLVLANHDLTFEGDGLHASFPPVPAPVKWVLGNVCGRWNAQWWVFSTCGWDGKPRELAFLGK